MKTIRVKMGIKAALNIPLKRGNEIIGRVLKAIPNADKTYDVVFEVYDDKDYNEILQIIERRKHE